MIVSKPIAQAEFQQYVQELDEDNQEQFRKQFKVSSITHPPC